MISQQREITGARIDWSRFKIFGKSRSSRAEQFRIVNDAVFDDLGEAGAEFAVGQGFQRVQIAQHQLRLEKGADEILAGGSGIVYFDSGRGGKGLAVDPGGSGDVSATHVRWTGPDIPEAISSPIIVGPNLYRGKPGNVECWEAASGKKVYAERLPQISTTWASPIADGDGRLYFARAGKSYVIQSGPEFRILAVNDLGDGNHCLPAVAQGRLFLAGLKNRYCIGSGK